MSQTTSIVNQLLTNVSNISLPDKFIAESILPSLKVKQTTGLIGSYGNNHLRIVNTIMGGKGKAPTYESITREGQFYKIDNHGLENLVTKSDYDNVENPFDAEQDETIGLTTVLQVGKEKAMASNLTNSDLIKQNTKLADKEKFSNYKESEPLDVFRIAQSSLKKGCGLPPNKAIMSWEVFNALSYSPKILTALGYTQARAGTLSEDELAKAMKVEKLFIATSFYNASDKGTPDSLEPIWPNDIIFYYAPDTAGKYQVSLGYYITRIGDTPRKVYKYPENNPPESNRILVTDDYGISLTNVSAAYLIKGAI
ncbi:MAG: hypothetical protein HQK51_17915 [Oligoflexia bacterium]|nr:hypothetical protein [Oligoflexia bacterium]